MSAKSPKIKKANCTPPHVSPMSPVTNPASKPKRTLFERLGFNHADT